MRKFGRTGLLLAGVLLSPVAPLHAQSLFQPESMTHFRNIDPTATGAIPVAPSKAPFPAAPRPASGIAALAVAGGPVLRHLPNNAQGMRLGGEIGASEWPVYFTSGEVSQPLKFQLGYLSAVSNLPQASRLSILVNDVLIGELAVDAPNKVKTSSFDVPPDLLKPGFNSLRILAQHRHRVDCSLTATYELWTQIDATQTGFLFPANDLGATVLEDIPALPPGPQGGMPIRVLLPMATNATAIEQMIRMVESVAIRGRFEQPLVEVGNSLADGPGVNLAAGRHEDLIRLGGLEGLADPAGPSLEFLPATAQRRATIVASGRTSAEVDQALAYFAEFPPSTGSPQGLRSALAFPGYRVEGGSRIKLRDLGVISQEFNGHLFHTSMNIVMPPDFYPADYAKFSLDLAGGYAPGLATGAQIVISINSKIAVGSELAKSGGEVFKSRSIDLPLGMLRPGLNKLDIDAHLPMAEDASCDPAAASTGRKRFLLLDETALVMPAIARVALSPNLAITATGGFPFTGSRLNSHLFIPNPDPDTLAAAATLAARMSLSGGLPLDFHLSLSSPPLEDGSTLVVAAAPALTPAALALAGIDSDQVLSIWKPRAFQPRDAGQSQALSKYEALNQARIALQRNFPAECRMREVRAKPRAPVGANAAGKTVTAPVSTGNVIDARPKPAGLAEQWDQSVNGSRSWINWPAWAHLPAMDGAIFSNSSEWVAAQFAWSKDQLAGTVNGERETVIDERASLLMAQKNHGTAGEGIWTLVTAATPADLKQNVFCLVDPRVWSQVAGETAALNSSEAKVNSIAARDPHFITTQALSYSNVRLIAAGWFSLNRWVFVAVIMMMALVLAGVTLLFVKNIGRRA